MFLVCCFTLMGQKCWKGEWENIVPLKRTHSKTICGSFVWILFWMRWIQKHWAVRFKAYTEYNSAFGTALHIKQLSNRTPSHFFSFFFFFFLSIDSLLIKFNVNLSWASVKCNNLINLWWKAIEWNILDDKLTSAHSSSWFWYPVWATVNSTYLNNFSIQRALSVTKLENSLNWILNWIILMKMSRNLLASVCIGVLCVDACVRAYIQRNFSFVVMIHMVCKEWTCDALLCQCNIHLKYSAIDWMYMCSLGTWHLAHMLMWLFVICYLYRSKYVLFWAKRKEQKNKPNEPVFRME